MAETSETYDEWLKKARKNPNNLKIHHRSSPGPDKRKPWERGGMSEAEYKKLPQEYKDMLN